MVWLPDELEPLRVLAKNLRWSWHLPTQKLFRDINPTAWDKAGRSPLGQLASVTPESLITLAESPVFVQSVKDAAENLATYMAEDCWFQLESPLSGMKVAYFSPEFGITEAIAQYAGGLGILAGDHLKTASDLGVPLVAVGLFYKVGYFKQTLENGRQGELYPEQDAARLGFDLCDEQVSFPIGDQQVTARIWRAQVGRVELYLLDTVHEANDSGARSITDRLYGGGSEHRLAQEMELGIGGIKALRAMGIDVNVYHTNEGHAGFLGVERLRELIVDQGVSFNDAIAQVRQTTVFTTHTPVPAGIDQFSRGLMEKYFTKLAQDCGITMDQLMALGQMPGAPSSDNFNMAYLGMRLAERVNGVSKLHGEVSRSMFAKLFGTSPENTPIGHITNGVHPPTWVTLEMAAMFKQYIGSDWSTSGEVDWQAAWDIPDEVIWNLRNQARENLVKFIRKHVRDQQLAAGLSDTDESPDTAWCLEMFDPNVLTIGFARRAATYKRLDLLLSQPERLKKLLLDKHRPVQFVFAGKSHPDDQGGKDLIARVVAFAQEHGVRHRIVFLPDYNMGVARALLDADVWLNTPERPLEASGTSGEKSVYHLGLQLSIEDGWWAEMAKLGVNGWSIPEGHYWDDTASNLFELIEDKLVRAFYDRDEQNIPFLWTALIKGSLATLGWRVSSARMMRDYVNKSLSTRVWRISASKPTLRTLSTFQVNGPDSTQAVESGPILFCKPGEQVLPQVP
jgi:starch phosphorylase